MPRNVQNKPPTISVVIPTYNSGPYIDDALASIWKQTLLPDEIIVVDDRSSDGTPERVEALAKRSPVPLRVIRRETNSGFPGRPMNDGVAAANGELIAILDHDDVWLPTKLQMQSQALRSRPDASFAFSLHLTMGSPRDCRKRMVRRSAWLEKSMSRDGELYRCPGPAAFDLLVEGENFVVGFPGFMFRRSSWQYKNGFDESVKIATDYEFLLWLCGQGEVVFIPEVHFHRREHEDNLTGRELLRIRDVVRLLLRYIPAAEMAARRDYQRVFASKLFTLAKHFARAGRTRQGMQLLGLVGEMEFTGLEINWLRRTLPTKLLRLRAWRATGLGPRVRDVSAAEADDAVSTLRGWLEDYRLPAPGDAAADRAADA